MKLHSKARLQRRKELSQVAELVLRDGDGPLHIITELRSEEGGCSGITHTFKTADKARTCHYAVTITVVPEYP